MNGTRVSRWTEWLIALCVAVASAAIVIWQNSHVAVLWDLSYILENSYRMSLGQIPYRDFPFPYAPLTFLTQAALIKLTGRVFFHHVIYCAIVNGLSVLLTWRILLRILYATTNKRLVALVLTIPLAVLSVYGIFPHPFYDCDCTFVVLICLFLLSRFQHRAAEGTPENGDAAIPVGSLLESFFAGVLLIIPFFIKQNTGGAFLISAVGCLVLLFLIDIYSRRNITKYILLLAGLIMSLGVAILLIHHFAGLHNYYKWTFRFAAQQRMPAFADMIGMYKDTGTVWWLLPVVVGLILMWLSRRNRQIGWLSMVFILVPFVWPVIYLVLDNDASERAERLVNLWPSVLILSVVAILPVIRRRSVADLLIPAIVIATVHGAFFSQQLWGSTYALWPMFVILIAFVTSALCWGGGSSVMEGSSDISQALLNGQVTISAFVLASVISFSLLIAGAFYVRSHERLGYADLDDGDLAHSTNPALKGMATRGSWLTDFDELVAYADKEIPREDGILCLPGEDLFYYTTGRRPQFPVVMFDHTVNPYSPQEIVDIARERNINWLIVKNDLQLEEEPIERKDELMNLLMQQFESVESLNNYEIYKRTSADEDDDGDDDEKAPATAPINFTGKAILRSSFSFVIS
jgi:hypothetical protein